MSYEATDKPADVGAALVNVTSSADAVIDSMSYRPHSILCICTCIVQIKVWNYLVKLALE